MIKDLVSVIIPTHKRPQLLKKAVRSALDQTYSQIEIIIVDDNSGDNTEQVVKEFGDGRIRYFKNTTSSGGAATRNAGIESSQGEFIAFLDDDDVWYRNKVELQIRKIKENDDNVLCTCGLQVVYVAEGLKYFNFPKLEGVNFEKMLLNNRVGITSTVLVRKAALEKAGPFDTQLPAREEYELWIRLSRTGKLVSVNEPLMDYFIHPSRNQISASIGKFVTANGRIREKYRTDYEKMPVSKIKELDADNLFQYSTIAMNNRKKAAAVKYIIGSLSKKFAPGRLIIMASYILGFRAYIFLKQYYGNKLKKKYERI